MQICKMYNPKCAEGEVAFLHCFVLFVNILMLVVVKFNKLVLLVQTNKYKYKHKCLSVRYLQHTKLGGSNSPLFTIFTFSPLEL